MEVNVFETAKLKLTHKAVKGKPKSDSCEFVFTKDGQAWKTEKVAFKGTEAKFELEFPAVEKDKNSYKIEYLVKSAKEGGGTEDSPGTDHYMVWPKKLKLTAKGPDGKVLAGTTFNITQNGKTKTVAADKNGVVSHSLEKAAFTVDAKSPYKVDKWDKEKGTERTADVHKLVAAVFTEPLPSKDNKAQSVYVNQDTAKEGRDLKGTSIMFKVASKDNAGKKGDIIYVQVKFGRESTRATPTPELTAAASITKEDSDKLQKGQVMLDKDGGGAQFQVWLGVAGGDTCEVKIGSTVKCEDAVIKLVNWRKLEYEIWQPQADGADKATDYTLFKTATEAGLPDKTVSYMDETLKEVFIEFKEKKKDFFKKSDLPLAGVHNVFDAAYIEKDAGKKVVILTSGQLNGILAAKAVNRGDNRVVTMVWTDYYARLKSWDQKFTGVFKETDRIPNKKVFKNALDTDAGLGSTHGKPSIKKISWKVTEYYDDTGKVWKPVAAPGDPGYAYRNNTDITVEADILAHVEFTAWKTIKIKLPDTKAGFPGHDLPKDGSGQLTAGGKNVQIDFHILGVGAEFGVNGSALRGDIKMNTFAGEVKPVGMGGVILHELGHNMGQAYANNTTDATFGRKPANAIPGLPFPKDVAAGGDMYGGHQHQGTHCAKGLKDKTGDDFNTAKAYKERKCIMFGGSDMESATVYRFCVDCKTYIKAEILDNIRKSWSA
ncbi:MAG: hypothetical protein JWO30_2034 [Fibrobacteres bacterium]|nr:hypothetical protein [Fibrobacterota bacterium]